MTTAQFKDRDDQTWSLEIDFPILSQIKKELDVNLLVEEGLAKLCRCEDPEEDFARMAAVLYVICQEQAEKLSVSDVQFGRKVGKADVFVEAVRALNEALVAFYRGVGMTPLATLIETAMELKPEMMERIDAKISPSTIKQLLTKSMNVYEKQLDLQLSKAQAEVDAAIRGNEPSNSPPLSESQTSISVVDSPIES